MAALTVVAQALPASSTDLKAVKPSKAVGPPSMRPPFAATQRTVLYALNSTSFAMSDDVASTSKFVRPDCPPVEEEVHARRPARKPAAQAPKSPRYAPNGHFRSALEQVSYDTNKKLWNGDEDVREPKRGPLHFLGL